MDGDSCDLVIIQPFNLNNFAEYDAQITVSVTLWVFFMQICFNSISYENVLLSVGTAYKSDAAIPVGMYSETYIWKANWTWM